LIHFKQFKRYLLFGVADALFFCLALFFAYWLRYNGFIPREELLNYYRIIGIIVVLKIIFFSIFRIYTQMWTFMGFIETFYIGLALFIAEALIWSYSIIFFRKNAYLIPRSVIILDLVFSFLFAAGYRYLLKLFFNRQRKILLTEDRHIRTVLIFGAGEAGGMVLKEINRSADLRFHVIGFLDDDPQKWGLRINNKPVLGGLEKLKPLYQKHKFKELIIAMPSAPAPSVRRIISECSELKDMEIKIVPGTRQIIEGQVKWSNIRDVSIEDLLGREPVVLDNREISEYIRNKSVLVTGAGGSIGSELVRQVLSFHPKRLVMLGKGENSIYHADMDMRKLDPVQAGKLVSLIGDVKDRDRMQEIFDEYGFDIVFHAAAHKHVPLMENNPKEAFKNNVLGTRTILEQAANHKVGRFVLISTDKAVNPTSVMGATKRIAEILLQAQAEKNPGTKFTAVRFGNVLGSRGSVIPLFKQQIAEGGPVTVTHKDVIRYFMTIPEATGLVLQSGGLAKGGEIFILDMGKPVNIYEMARNLIRLSGLKPDEDIRIKVTGLRPGEKLYEEILTRGEGVTSTRFKKIFIAQPEKQSQDRIKQVNELATRLHNLSANEVKKKIFKIVK
jgi:FlaA1/EpsC-like NDP-sugar epimerase